jgi:hypothetical protein
MKKYILSILLSGAFMFTACSDSSTSCLKGILQVKDIIKQLSMLNPPTMLFMIY